MPVVHAPPNEIEHVDTLWAVLSVDETGEGLCGALIGDRWVTLTSVTERMVEKFLIPTAKQVSKMTGKKLRLVKFTSREDLQEFGL